MLSWYLKTACRPQHMAMNAAKRIEACRGFEIVLGSGVW